MSATDSPDFQPGDVLMCTTYTGRCRGPYTVCDPVRTRRGKVRLRGPKGGYFTAWWRLGQQHPIIKIIGRGETPAAK